MAGQLPDALDAVKAAVRDFDRANSSGAPQDRIAFIQSATRMGVVMQQILETLKETTTLRLISEGVAPSAAPRRAEESFRPILRLPLDFGYNWDVLEQRLQEEIEAAEQSLDALVPDMGLEVQIQAHLIKDGGDEFAIHLPGHNEVPTGPSSVYEKIRFHMTDEEQQVFENRKQLAQNLKTVNNVGEAFLELLRVDAQAHASKLETLQQGFGKVRDSLEVLAKWADSERLEAWLTRDLKNQLQQTDAGKQFLATWQKVRKIPEEVKSDVELVRGYADFRFTFTGMGSEQTMSSILGVLRSLPLPSGSTNDLDVLRILYHQRWQQRFDDIAEFLNSLEALTEEAKGVIQSEGGPVSDFVAARDSIATLIEVLRSFGDEARQWLTQLVGTDRPMRAATQLAPPEGQKQRPVTGNLDTAFNLTTVRQSREKGDEVRVHYQFYKGNQQLEGKGWTDRFVIRIFGWQDKVLASVVFTQQNGQSDFEPTAAVSWILSNNRWPSSNDTGLNGLQGIRWFSGFGISTMALDYEEEETVELGIAATISLVNDRLLFGYGANLQGQQDKGFWFFAFQLFSTPGFVQSGR